MSICFNYLSPNLKGFGHPSFKYSVIFVPCFSSASEQCEQLTLYYSHSPSSLSSFFPVHFLYSIIWILNSVILLFGFVSTIEFSILFVSDHIMLVFRCIISVWLRTLGVLIFISIEICYDKVYIKQNTGISNHWDGSEGKYKHFRTSNVSSQK